MRPLTLTVPKPLLKIQNKTILDWIFDAFPEEITEAIVVVKYLSEKIKDYLGYEYKGRKIQYVDGSEKGNAIGFMATKKNFKGGERFFIFHGDEPQRKKEIEECLKKQYAWVCAKMPNHKKAGIADVAADGRILEVIERPEYPKSDLVAMGTILVDANIFKYAPVLHANGEYHLTSMLDQFIKNHAVFAIEGIARPTFNSLSDLEWKVEE